MGYYIQWQYQRNSIPSKHNIIPKISEISPLPILFYGSVLDTWISNLKIRSSNSYRGDNFYKFIALILIFSLEFLIGR